MHLFVLLLTVVFASDFVAPNEILSIASVDPPTVSQVQVLTTLPAFEVVLEDDSGGANAAGELTWNFLDADKDPDSAIEIEGVTGADLAWTIPAGKSVAELIKAGVIPAAFNIQVSEELDDGSAEFEFEIEVEEAAAWTVGPEGGIEVDDVVGLPALTFATEDDRGWTGSMVARFEYEGNEVEAAITRTAGDPNTYATAAIADISALELELTDLPVDLTVSIILVEATDANADEILHPKTATLTVDRAPFVHFTAEPASFTPEQITAQVDFEVLPAEGVEWDRATVELKAGFTKTDDEKPESYEYDLVNPEEADEPWTFQADLTALELAPADTEFFLWLKNGAEEYDLPLRIEYDAVPEPVGTFTIAPDTWAYEVLGAQSVKLVFTDTSEAEPTPTGWATTMKAQFKYGNAVKTADVTRKGDAAPYTGEITTVDLSELGVPTTGGTIKVSLSPANTVKFIEPAVDLVISPKVEVLEFSFTPDKIEGAKLETEIDISAAPVTAGAWDAVEVVKVIFTLTNDPPANEPAGLTFTLDAPATAGDPWTGKATLTALVVPEEQESVWVWAKVDGTVLPVGKQVDYEAGEDPEPVVLFTVEPTTIDLRTTTKATITVKQKEQTEETAWEEKVFLYFSLTEGEPDEDTLVKPAVLKDGTTDTWTVAELTLAEIEGIAKDKTVYVYLEHGAEEGLDGTIEEEPATIAITQSAEPEEPEAAMGVSPLLSLLAALVFLFVKLF